MTRSEDIEKLNALIDFGKFGFKGTLATALSGILLLLALALLDAFTDFEIQTWGLVGLALIFLAGGVAFGYFSLRQLPAVAVKIRDMTVGVHDAGASSRRDP